MGRPKTIEPRNRQLNLSLTMAELTRLEERARAVGMRPVHFSRAALLDALHGSRESAVQQPAADAQQQRLLYTQLARLGNLLNQLVRHLHQTGAPLPPDLEPLLRDIRALITQVRP